MIGDLVTARAKRIDRAAEIRMAGGECSTGSNWTVSEGKSTKWTAAENKLFENALAVFGENLQDRWLKVASEIPGKTVADVIAHYKELEADVSNIEAGLIPVPGYSSSQFSLDWLNKHGDEGFRQSYSVGGRKSSSTRAPEQERKKGVPWTEEEHKLFLLGLKKYGKGDWRNISRNFVVTRTPTQVASHAQKYFIRQLSGGKDKRRSSIHDITTVNINDARSPSPEEKKPQPVEYSGLQNHQPNSGVWNLHNSGETSLGYNQGHGIMYMPSSFGLNGSYGLGNQPFNGAQEMVFQSYPRRS